MNLHNTILTWLLLIPLAASLLIFLVRSAAFARVFSLLASLAVFALSLYLPWRYNSSLGGMQFRQRLRWIPAFHIHYSLGVDGLGLWMAVLTALLFVIALWLACRRSSSYSHGFFALLLLLEAAMLGVFSSLDLILFYFCWEFSLVPMALLIGIWGGPARRRAAVRFFLYTMLGSVFMLAAILWLYHLTGSFGWQTLHRELALRSSTLASPLASSAALWLFLGFFIAFAIKTPVFPFHGWQPEAYSEAPDEAAVVLAGGMSKMGLFGMLRYCVLLFPFAARQLATPILVLGLIGIVYGGLVAYVQTGMKKLVAYSSLSHLGLIVVGIFTFTQLGAEGAIYQMLSHGIIAAGLFCLIGILWRRRQSYELADYGGVAVSMPVFAGFFIVIMLAAAGLPLLNGFVGEFLILLGSFLARHGVAAIAATGVILSVMYLLRWTRATLWGEPSAAVQKMPGLGFREGLLLAMLAVLMLVMGVASPWFLRPIAPVAGELSQTSLTATALRRPSASPAGWVEARAPRRGMRGGR